MLLFIIAQCILARTSYDSLKMKIDYNTKRELFSKCKFKIEENKNVFYFSTAAPAYYFFCQSLNSRIPCLRCAFQTKPGSSSFFPPRCTFSQQRTQTFVVHAANKHIWISMCDVQGLESVPAHWSLPYCSSPNETELSSQAKKKPAGKLCSTICAAGKNTRATF